MESLPPERLRRFEEESLAILRSPAGKDIRLSDVVGVLPDLDVSEAREVLGYLKGVRSLRLEADPSWHLDPLIRRALDLPKEAWTLRGLARELNIGPYEAKKLEASLKIFEGGGYRVKTKAPPPPEKSHIQRAPVKEAPAHPPRADVVEEPTEVPPRPRPPPHPPETRPPPPPPEAAPPVERPKKREDADASRDFSRL